MASFESWGRNPKVRQSVKQLFWSTDFPVRDKSQFSQLPAGMGRSYGDVCLNEGNTLLLARGLDRLLAFDPETGILCCEAGVTLAEILDFSVPRGWFIPVTPGTKYVTVGGAIANDVHGKNHHVAGTFGRHVLRLMLARSDGTHIECSPFRNTEWFASTIGGLGLTGLILWAEIQLKRIASRSIECHAIQFHGLSEFMALSEANRHVEYTVAWVDSMARGRNAMRGIFFGGEHCISSEPLRIIPRTQIAAPFNLPGFALNRATMTLFNTFFFHKQLKKQVRSMIDYEPFFYPLDSVLHWNRLYGKLGLLQFQCVVPFTDGLAAIQEILNVIAKSGLASFLAVLKIFGDSPSPGWLSFPRPGITLALDFPIKSERTFFLVDQLGDMTLAAGGRIYPAKDARMTPSQFRAFYPAWQELAKYIDPQFSSSFWRRVNGE